MALHGLCVCGTKASQAIRTDEGDQRPVLPYVTDILHTTSSNSGHHR